MLMAWVWYRGCGHVVAGIASGTCGAAWSRPDGAEHGDGQSWSTLVLQEAGVKAAPLPETEAASTPWWEDMGRRRGMLLSAMRGEAEAVREVGLMLRTVRRESTVAVLMLAEAARRGCGRAMFEMGQWCRRRHHEPSSAGAGAKRRDCLWWYERSYEREVKTGRGSHAWPALLMMMVLKGRRKLLAAAVVGLEEVVMLIALAVLVMVLLEWRRRREKRRRETVEAPAPSSQ